MRGRESSDIEERKKRGDGGRGGGSRERIETSKRKGVVTRVVTRRRDGGRDGGREGEGENVP